MDNSNFVGIPPRTKAEVGALARKAAVALVKMGYKTLSEGVRRLKAGNVEFETVNYNTLNDAVKKLRASPDVVHAVVGDQQDVARELDPEIAQLSKQDRRVLWIRKATRDWWDLLFEGRKRGLRAVCRVCSDMYGIDAAWHQNSVRQYVST